MSGWELWILSSITLAISSYYWAMSDTYFWDAETAKFVKKWYKDWHNTKTIWIAAFILSVRAVPWNWVAILSWLVLRWSTWEVSMKVVRMDGTRYVGCHRWLGGKFYLPFTMGVVVSALAFLAPLAYFICN